MTQLQKQRILITGVNGQVGYELVKSLSVMGADLVLAYRNPKPSDGFGYQTVAMNLEDDSDVRKVLGDVRPSVLINPAAYTAVDKAESEPDKAYQVNQMAVKAMVDSLRKWNGAIIHFSTDYVYNSDHQLSNSENGPTRPGNVYAASKLAGEMEILQSEIPYLILRTSWVYGINGNNFVKTMLRLGRDRETLNVVNDQIGSPTSAVTLAQSVATILNQVRGDLPEFIREKSGIFNLSDRGYTHWQEFAQEIFRHSRENSVELKIKEVNGIPTNEYKTPALRPLNSRLDLSKLEKVFGIVPPRWQQSLAVFLSQSRLTLN